MFFIAKPKTPKKSKKATMLQIKQDFQKQYLWKLTETRLKSMWNNYDYIPTIKTNKKDFKPISISFYPQN